MTFPARPRPSGVGTSNGSTGSRLVPQQLSDRVLISCAVIAVVLRGRPCEIIGEPDDTGGPDQGHPAAPKDRAGAHREHARDYAARKLRLGFLARANDL